MDIWKLASVTIALVLTTSVNASIYNVNRDIGMGTVSGFIETDGTIGVLTDLNILSWELSIASPNLLSDSPSLISSNTGRSAIWGTATTATATQLLFDFNTDGLNGFILSDPSTFVGRFWCLETSGCTSTNGFGEYIGNLNTHGEIAESTLQSGEIVFAEVSPIPVPAAVWLFGSGLIGLVSLAKRKKA